jgi:succinyl-CoA synthetase beta subunit
LSRTKEEAEKNISQILGMKLVSKQMGPQGRIVKKILIEQGLNIVNELYLAIIIDREKEMPVVIASTEGGMEIEEVADNSPELIHKSYIHPVTGISGFHARELSFKLGLNKIQQKNFSKLLFNLYKLFLEKDCSLLEINPLIVTNDDQVIALDGKINFDDNGLYRHPDIVEMRDIEEEEPLEVEASKFDLNYIKLDGNIGCMVNGAGLAMATMDIIKYYGGEPANFLDVGGGTSEERVKEAFNILLSDKNVKGVFVNIFGGIVRTDLVANGIVNALKNVELKIPIVIRLVGTNQEEGRKIIDESGLDFVAITDLPDAAKKAVELVKEQ